MIKTKTELELIKALIQDVAEGRPIVPLIGAGFSVESGIPALSGLTEYLAKVQCYILQSVFSPGTVLRDRRVGSSYQDPSLFIGDFGWPDPHRMNGDLWTWVDSASEGHPEYRSLLEHQVQAELLRDIGRHDPGLRVLIQERLVGRDLLRLLEETEGIATDMGSGFKQLREISGPVPRILLLREFLESEPAAELFKKAPHLQPALEAELKAAGPFPELSLKGNWKTLLGYLTNSNPDFIDILFQSLVKGRQPGITHRFLAFLTPVLNLRLFLTVNFDHLLEKALRLEGLQPTVYEVSRESPLPHPSLVQKELSVVKLHGGAFGLRVGEELEQPLDEDSRRRLDLYLPQDPVLLVMGIGGWDRRIRDIVELVAKRRRSRPFSVYWMHFEPECPEPVRELANRVKPRKRISPICPVRTYSPSAFLQELYYRSTSSHPPSIHAYSPVAPRPIDSTESRKRAGKKNRKKRPERPIHVFLNEAEDLSLSASLRLVQFVSSKSASHTPIWVDLEMMHSPADVTAEIFRQVRKYDRWLSPDLLPSGSAPDNPDEVSKAVRRIFTALSRGRYLLAFNSVGSFGRPPTFHHGWTQLPEDREKFFLRIFHAAHHAAEGAWGDDKLSLSIGPLKDSILAFAIDPLGSRDGRASGFPKLYDELQHSSIVELHRSDRTLKAPQARRDSTILLVLSAFRRRRSIVALRRLLPELVPRAFPVGGKRENQIDDLLFRLQRKGYIKRLEGGQYWMNPGMRNRIYELGQRCTDSKTLARAIRDRNCDSIKAPLNLSRLAAIHESIADFYYSELFAASRDAAALMEHLYHRISSLRYLTKLDAWIPQEGLGRLGDAAAARLGRHFHRWRLPSSEPVRASLRTLRLHSLQAIRAALEREREQLLSEVASDTLIGWIDWIRDNDVSRFLVASCLDSGGGIPAEAVVVDTLEQRIADECEALRHQLDELKADALQDKTDFLAWAELRDQQLRKLLSLATPDPPILPLLIRGIHDLEHVRRFDEDLDAVCERSRNLDLDTQRKVVLILCDVCACLRGCGESKLAEQILLRLDQIMKRCSEVSDRGLALEQMQLAVLRSKADQGLAGLSPWSDRIRRPATCGRTIDACREALRIIEWGAGGEYGRYKSYFHSLKGRAHYLQGELAEAFREIDLSQVGLTAQLGGTRETLAISLLRLAEFLMVQADMKIAKVESWQLAMTYSSRNLFRAEDVLERAEEMLMGAWQNVEWWGCLYQLKAQVQVEHLLLQAGEARGKAPLEAWRRRFIAQFSQRLKTGLRAIRQGLDVVPRIRNEEPISSRDFRLTRLMQVWMELMICGAFLTRRVASGAPFPEPKLWERWKFMNESVGIRALDKTHSLFQGLDETYAPQKYPDGKEGREKALIWIRECVNSGAVEKLVNDLGS